VKTVVLKKAVVVAVVAMMAGGLAGCSGSEPQNIEVADAWVKAVDGGMTGMFAELSNPTSEDVFLVGGSSVAAGFVEVHEVADGVMREKDGGVLIPAGGTATLMPGGDHVMLMALTGPILAGDTVAVTLLFSNGEEMTLDVLAKEFAGANEDYESHGHGNDQGHGEENGHGHSDDHSHDHGHGKEE
jgi:copper(I)-binding protein